jgi:hypothetical protein
VFALLDGLDSLNVRNEGAEYAELCKGNEERLMMKAEEETLKAYSYRGGSSQTPEKTHMQGRRIRPAIPLIKPAQPEKESRPSRKNVVRKGLVQSGTLVHLLPAQPGASSSLLLQRDAALVNCISSSPSIQLCIVEGERHLRVSG